MSRLKLSQLLIATFMLAGLASQTTAEAGKLTWQTNYEQAKKQSAEESKPMVVMFTASWCGPCQRMKSTTLSDSAVEAALEKSFIPVMLDTDKNREITRHFGISAIPAIVVVAPGSDKNADATRGVVSKSDFLAFLNRNKPNLELAGGQSKDSGKSMVKQVNAEELDDSLLTPYCLVTIIDEGKLVKGQAAHAVTHQGQNVNFASAEKRERFLSQPESFWPQLDGNCPVALKETGNQLRGDARWTVEYDSRLFFCHSREHATKFLKTPAAFAPDEVKVGEKPASSKSTVN